MMKHIIPFFLLFLLAYACKKENCPWPNTIVSGTVVDDSTKLPIESAEVTLERWVCKESSWFSPGCDKEEYIFIKKTLTDGSGNFSFEFCKNKKRRYNLSVKKEGYWTNNVLKSPGFRMNIDEFLNTNRIISLTPQ